MLANSPSSAPDTKHQKPLPKKGAVCIQWVRCCQPGCRCARGKLHGPYHYLFWREGGRLRKRYVRLADVAAAKSNQRPSNDVVANHLHPDDGAEPQDALPGLSDDSSEPKGGAASEQEAAAQPQPELNQPFRPILKGEETEPRKPMFRRPARSVKSESTVQAFESVLQAFQQSRREEEAPAAPDGKTHYLVWQIELGARIFKVPEGKLDLIKKPPDAHKLKLFDNLEHAKAEANAIFKRVAADRMARGLPTSSLEPTLQELMRWEENNVPDYFV